MKVPWMGIVTVGKSTYSGEYFSSYISKFHCWFLQFQICWAKGQTVWRKWIYGVHYWCGKGSFTWGKFAAEKFAMELAWWEVDGLLIAVSHYSFCTCKFQIGMHVFQLKEFLCCCKISPWRCKRWVWYSLMLQQYLLAQLLIIHMFLGWCTCWYWKRRVEVAHVHRGCMCN